MTRTSPLDAEHRSLDAKMVEFGGWEMPLSYAGRGIIAEHMAVRERVGLFDVSHLGKVKVGGDGAQKFLDRILPGRIPAAWRASYNLVLNDGGGIVDDIFVYRRPEFFVLVPNAANTEAVLEILDTEAGESVAVEDSQLIWGILALQGPGAKDLAEKLAPHLLDIRLHTFADTRLDGIDFQAARTGYTGEYGFEFFVEWDAAPLLWNLLLEAGEPFGISPAGLGARDTLRLEMGYPLHGHEIDEEVNPFEASLGWVIDPGKAHFKGREALEKARKAGLSRKLVGLIAKGREIPRAGYLVLHEGKAVGKVTSGNFSPVLRQGIAMAYVPPDLAAPGTMLFVDVRGREAEFEVVKPPFVKSRD